MLFYFHRLKCFASKKKWELERRKEKVIALCPHEMKIFCHQRRKKKRDRKNVESGGGGGGGGGEIGSQPAPYLGPPARTRGSAIIFYL